MTPIHPLRQGLWAEDTPGSAGHRHSTCKIAYNAADNRYEVSGTNYWDDGRPHCTFHTVSSHLNMAERRLYYIFKGITAEGGQEYTGFGVLYLAPTSTGELIPTGGHFVAVGEEPQSFAHTMVPVTVPLPPAGPSLIKLLRRLQKDTPLPVSPPLNPDT